MSVRSLGSLTLDMVLKTGNFLGPMDKASRKTRSTTKAMQDDFKKVAAGVGAVVAAGAAATTALVAFTDRAGQNARELRNQAQVANASVEELQRMAYGTREFGIEQDKLSDILKDVNDRIGDFRATGGGAMADFFENVAPKIGITADAFRNLSGPQALQLYYDSLEKANLSQEDLTFYLEAMASDTTALIPLLRDGGKGLAEMADEADRLGLVMSGVEVEMLTQVSNELDKARAVAGAVGNALAIELAPIVLAVADHFGDVAEEAGSVRDVVSGMVDTSVIYLGKFLDSVWEIDKRIQQAGVMTRRFGLTIVRSMAEGTRSIIEGPVNAINNLIEQMNRVPGVDMGFVSQPSITYRIADQVVELEAAIASANAELDDLAAGGPPSERLNAFIAQAREAANALGEGGITPPPGSRPPPGNGGGGDDDATSKIKSNVDAIKTQIATLEQQAATLGMADDAVKLYALEQDGATTAQLAAARAALETIAAYESSEKAADDYKQLVADLRTQEEKLTDQVAERLAVLDAANVAGEEYAEVAARIAAAGFADAPEYGGLDATIGGAFGELNKIDEAEERLQEWYTTQLEMLDQYRQERADLTEQWNAEELALKEEHEAELARIEQARQIAQLAAAESTFGDLAGLAKTFAGEQSATYRALFAVEKSFAIAKAMMNAPKAYSDAYAAMVGIPYVGPVLAPAAGATAAAAQIAQASAIGAVGMAHDGIDSVPQTGTWILEKGERVTTADTSAKMDDTLAKTDAMLAQFDRNSQRPGAAGGLTVNLIEDRKRAGQVDERTAPDGNRIIDVVVANIMGDGKAHKALKSKYGLSTRATN